VDVARAGIACPLAPSRADIDQLARLQQCAPEIARSQHVLERVEGTVFPAPLRAGLGGRPWEPGAL